MLSFEILLLWCILYLIHSNCFNSSRQHSHHTGPKMTLRSLLCFIKLFHLWEDSENIVYFIENKVYSENIVYDLWIAVETVDIISPNKTIQKCVVYDKHTSIFGLLANVLYGKTFCLSTPLSPLRLRHFPRWIFKLFKWSWVLVLIFGNFNYIFLSILIEVKLFAIPAFRGHLVTNVKSRYHAS